MNDAPLDILLKTKSDFFENVDALVWHIEVNFRISVCQLVIYIYMCVLDNQLHGAVGWLGSIGA